jgi:hypothetical protein
MDFSTNGIVTVIPAYRVQDTIASVLKDLPAYIEHIIVVDDASPDPQNLVAAQQDFRIVLVHHEKSGVGGAMVWLAALELGQGSSSNSTTTAMDLLHPCHSLVLGRLIMPKATVFAIRFTTQHAHCTARG